MIFTFFSFSRASKSIPNLSMFLFRLATSSSNVAKTAASPTSSPSCRRTPRRRSSFLSRGHRPGGQSPRSEARPESRGPAPVCPAPSEWSSLGPSSLAMTPADHRKIVCWPFRRIPGSFSLNSAISTTPRPWQMEPEFIFLFTFNPVSFSPRMSEFERLQRRNQDYVLLETIKQVGASNYSLIARLTGLNPETVRYKVSKQLAKLGLDLSINVNYSKQAF